MPSLKQKVLALKNDSFIGVEVECVYGTSKVGQDFAILVTKVLWYALRLIMDEEERDYGRNPSAVTREPWVLREQYLSQDDVLKRVRSLKSDLETGNFGEISKLVATMNNDHINIIDTPKDCATNPDRYLKPGDALRTYLIAGMHHDSIYIGKGKVAHVSSSGLKTSLSGTKKACVGLLLEHFVGKSDKTIQVLIYRVRCRRPEDIVKRAIAYTEKNFRDGKYWLPRRNCQHFVSLCATEYETSDEVKKVFTYGAVLGGLGLLAAFALADQAPKDNDK